MVLWSLWQNFLSTILSGMATINELRLLIRHCHTDTHMLIMHCKLIIKRLLRSLLILGLDRLTCYVLIKMVHWLALGVLRVKGLKLSCELFFLNFIVRAIHYLYKLI